MARVSTKLGDGGYTSLWGSQRVAKYDPRPEAYGTLDEANSALGLARALATKTRVKEEVLTIQGELYVLMAELATQPENRHKLTAGATLVTPEMLAFVEARTDDLSARFAMPTEFVLPGQNRMSALLEVARTVVRRAERRALPVAAPDSSVVPYLNRLSSLLWAMARWQEGEAVPAKES